MPADAGSLCDKATVFRDTVYFTILMLMPVYYAWCHTETALKSFTL